MTDERIAEIEEYLSRRPVAMREPARELLAEVIRLRAEAEVLRAGIRAVSEWEVLGDESQWYAAIAAVRAHDESLH